MSWEEEIREIERRGKIEELKAYMQRIGHLKKQRAQQGGQTDPSILVEIEEIEPQIKKLKQELMEDKSQTQSSIQGESDLVETIRNIEQTLIDLKQEVTALRVDFVLVTALAEERDAVLDKLPGYRKLPPSEDDIRTYFLAELPVTFPDDRTGIYHVIVMPLLGMGRVQATAATVDAIQRWQPRYIMLVGIAGGIAARSVSIGDILISDQIVDYELQKLTQQGPEIRWEVHRADPRLLNACHNFIGESWQELVRVKRPGRSKPKRHTGPIASGDKVIAFGDVLERYREVWLKLIGVEMEAAGVATAAFQSSEPPGFFMVRCVSDLADEHKDSADVEKWRSYACAAAASFAIALLKSGPVPLLNESKMSVESLPKDS